MMGKMIGLPHMVVGGKNDGLNDWSHSQGSDRYYQHHFLNTRVP